MNTDKQSLAHDLYFQTNKTQQEIAEILDVHRHTIRSWIKKNRWDEMKTAARQMPSLILQNIYNHITALNDKIAQRDESDRCPTMQEVGMLHKLLTMTKSIDKKHTGSYLEAFQELQLFIFNRDSALATQLRDHIAAYARGTLGDKEFMDRKRRKENVLEVTANLGREELRAQKEEQDVQKMEQPCTENVTCYNHETQDQQPAQENETREFHQFKNLENSDSDKQYHVQTAEQKSIENVQFCIEKVQPATTQSNASKVFTVAANGEIKPPQDSKKGNMQANSEDVTIPGDDDLQIDASKVFDKAMTLPPHMRPSPFIAGNTVWILHPDHLESRVDTYGNPWGPMKMHHTIRYYPDIDPANTKAA